MKVALYTRVSTLEQAQEGTSLEVQRERLQSYAQQNAWEIFYPEANKIYVDDGYSGSSMDRPAIKRLIQDAKLGKFNILLVYKIDRLSRDTRDLLNLVEELRRLNVETKSSTEPFDSSSLGTAMLQMAGVFAQLERAKIIERIVPGMIKSIEKGNWHGARYYPFGYQYNKESKLLEIVPKQVEIVRLIYTMYLANKSTNQITNYLNEKGYKTAKNNEFRTKAVCDILKNKIYIGKIVWNAHHYDKNQKTRKGHKYVKSDPSKIIEVDGKHKSIIAIEDFELVQKKLKRNLRGTLHRSASNSYPLSGVIDCADCGYKFRGKFNISNHNTGEKKRWYACNAKYEFGVNCSNGAVKADDLENGVFALLKVLLEHPDIKEGRISGISLEANQQYDAELANTKEELELKFKDNHRKQKANNDAHLEGFLTKDVFKEKMSDLRIEEKELLSKIDKVRRRQ